MTRTLAYFFAFSLQRVIVASSKWKYTVRCAAVLAVFYVGDDDKLYRDEAAVARTTLALAQAHSVCSRELVVTMWVIPCAAVLCHDIAPNCRHSSRDRHFKQLLLQCKRYLDFMN
jgi:hypothetical protein